MYPGSYYEGKSAFFVNATGKSKCEVCNKQISQECECIHLHVNSRAKPFICSDCIAQWARLLAKETELVTYEVWDLDGELMAKKKGEEGWLCEVTGYDHAAAQIALAEGQPSHRCRRQGPCGLAGETHVVYLLEIAASG